MSVLPAAHRGEARNIYPVVVWEIPHYLEFARRSILHFTLSEMRQSAVLGKRIKRKSSWTKSGDASDRRKRTEQEEFVTLNQSIHYCQRGQTEVT